MFGQLTVSKYCCLLLHSTYASSTTDMNCEIKSFCSPSGCQYNKSMTVDPGSNITRNCSISTGKLAKGMIWKQAKQEVQNSTGSSDLVLQESNSAKDSDNILCRCTAVNFARKCFLIWSALTFKILKLGKTAFFTSYATFLIVSNKRKIVLRLVIFDMK